MGVLILIFRAHTLFPFNRSSVQLFEVTMKPCSTVFLELSALAGLEFFRRTVSLAECRVLSPEVR